MQRIIAVLILGFVVAGCSGVNGSASNPPVTSSSPRSDTTAPEVPAAAKTIVPTARQVLGHWRVLSVQGRRPPNGSNRDLTMSERGGKYYATWSDGVNEHFREWFLSRGEFRKGAGGSTLVGCIGQPCGQPSGFGVSEAAALRLTTDDQLLFVDAQGKVVAIYGRNNTTMPLAMHP